jgi:hypothetical protein
MPEPASAWPYKRLPDSGVAGESPEEVGVAILRSRSRDLRRALGQFWTPDPIAELMVRWALDDRPGAFIDPGAGPLTFLRAAERVFPAGDVSCTAFELDPDLARVARASRPPAVCRVIEEDFLFTRERFPGLPVVCNPPYSRHHALRDDAKEALAEWARLTFGFRPSRFLGAYAWFFLRAADVAGPSARLCFITPVELFAARSALAMFRALPEALWPRRAVLFGESFDAFPGVDATAVVSLADPGASEGERFALVLRSWPGADLLLEWLSAPRPPRDARRWVDVVPWAPGRRMAASPAVAAPVDRQASEAAPAAGRARLSGYARVTRGVATGANRFFLFDRRRRDESGIDEAHFVRVIARARDAIRLLLDAGDLDALEARGRPTYLLALPRDARPTGPLAGYLAEGRRLDLPGRPLLSRRNPWWATEARDAPEILLTYLSRRAPRFILNEARAVPLTTFLAIRPGPAPGGVERGDWLACLAAALNGPTALASFAQHARSYGGTTRKIEPRELDRLELPALGALAAADLRSLAAAARAWLAEPSEERRRRAAAEWEEEADRLLAAAARRR